MTGNPLRIVEDKARPLTPSDPKERQRLWIDRGNRILWGQEPTSKGDYLPPRLDLQWACVNGNYFIEARR